MLTPKWLSEPKKHDIVPSEHFGTHSNLGTMGSYSNEPEFKTLTVNKLHPTFAAEVEGVDFQNLSDEQFEEILMAMAKVSFASLSLDCHSRLPEVIYLLAQQY